MNKKKKNEKKQLSIITTMEKDTTAKQEKRCLHNLKSNKFIKLYEENGKYWFVIGNMKLHEKSFENMDDVKRAAKRLPNETLINSIFCIAKIVCDQENSAMWAKYREEVKQKNNQ